MERESRKGGLGVEIFLLYENSQRTLGGVVQWNSLFLRVREEHLSLFQLEGYL